MNERLDLGGLGDDLDLPATRVADGAWERGRRRVRRRRTAGAAGVAGVVALVVAVVPVLLGGGGTPGGLEPAGPLPSLPSPTETVTGDAPTGDGLAPLTLSRGELEQRAAEATNIDRVEVVPLEGHPMDHALYAAGVDDGALVLGPDLRYRQISAPSDVALTKVQATSLSPDATRLVLALADAVVVADLTTGSTETIALPKSDVDDEAVRLQGWTDDTRVLVDVQLRGSFFVDVDSGTVSDSGFRDATAFGPEGPVSWSGREILTGDRLISTKVGSGGGAIVAGDGYAVATTVLDPDDDYPPETSTTYRGGPEELTFECLAVVDLETGDPQALLPLPFEAGASLRPLQADGDQVLVAVNYRGAPLIMWWDWRAGEVTAVAKLGPFLLTRTGDDLAMPEDQPYFVGVSWGTGLAELDTEG